MSFCLSLTRIRYAIYLYLSHSSTNECELYSVYENKITVESAIEILECGSMVCADVINTFSDYSFFIFSQECSECFPKLPNLRTCQVATLQVQ